MKKKSLLGAHMSIAGGIDQAFYRGAEIDCTAIQIFTHSNRQWAIKDISAATQEAAKEAQLKTGITQVMVHSSYLINLGSTSAEVVEKSVKTLKKELAQCDALGCSYLVLHPGSGENERNTIQQIGSLLNDILADESIKITLLLETMAGQGNTVAYQFEQLAAIKDLIKNKKKVGFCADTCHLWAAGYDFSTEKSYEKMWDDWDSILGLSDLKAFHLNDSKQQRGSRVDRHADIGKGTIGLEAFKLLMNDQRFISIPKILETPQDSLEDYARNLTVLKNLID